MNSEAILTQCLPVSGSNFIRKNSVNELLTNKLKKRLEQRFPKCASRIPGDPSVPRATVVVFLSWTL